MIRWALLGAILVVAAWAVYPNDLGIKKTIDAPRASALCKDATFSYSTNRSGTCSGRGGVQEWLE